MMRHVENLFWLICLAAIGLGLFVPQTGLWLKPAIRYLLMAILFFTCLKIDWHDVLGHVRQPLLLAYMTVMMLVLLPVGIWASARLVVPAFTLGVVIVAAMPAGMAASSLTHVAGGNAGLALLATAATTLFSPLTVPLMVRLLGGEAVVGGARLLAVQTGWLAVILFTPAALAALVRRYAARWVDRHKARFTGLSILSLGLLILSIMAANSEKAWRIIRDRPGQAVALFGFMTFFSVSLHASAFLWAYRRPWGDRVALSIGAAYVNNGLALAFATEFFRDNLLAVLPALAVEVPMVLCILPLRWYTRRRGAAQGRLGGTT